MRRCSATTVTTASPDTGVTTKLVQRQRHHHHHHNSHRYRRYVLREDFPYCIKCYENVFANNCDECGKIIGIDSKVCPLTF